MQNKLAKQSYFIKRLRDSGFYVERLIPVYSRTDPRMWTILINPKNAAILCTCYTNNGESERVESKCKNYFEIYDGGQFIPGRLTIATSSIETFITNLIQYGIEPVTETTKVTVRR